MPPSPESSYSCAVQVTSCVTDPPNTLPALQVAAIISTTVTEAVG